MPGPSRKSRIGKRRRPRRSNAPFGVSAATRFAALYRVKLSQSFTGCFRLSPLRGLDGFTLLEVLVALAILGMSLTVLLAIFSQALARDHDRNRAVAAREFAQTLIARTLAAQTAEPGETNGYTDAGLSWRLDIEPYGGESDRTAAGLKAVQVIATVTWPGTRNRQSLTLTTLRLVPTETGE